MHCVSVRISEHSIESRQARPYVTTSVFFRGDIDVELTLIVFECCKCKGNPDASLIREGVGLSGGAWCARFFEGVVGREASAWFRRMPVTPLIGVPATELGPDGVEGESTWAVDTPLRNEGGGSSRSFPFLPYYEAHCADEKATRNEMNEGYDEGQNEMSHGVIILAEK